MLPHVRGRDSDRTSTSSPTTAGKPNDHALSRRTTRADNRVPVFFGAVGGRANAAMGLQAAGRRAGLERFAERQNSPVDQAEQTRQSVTVSLTNLGLPDVGLIGSGGARRSKT